MNFLSGPKERLIIIGRGLECAEAMRDSKFGNCKVWTYNNIRPHDSLMDLTPRQFLLKYGKVDDFPTFQQDINMYNEYEKSILLGVAV